MNTLTEAIEQCVRVLIKGMSQRERENFVIELGRVYRLVCLQAWLNQQDWECTHG